MSWRSGIKSLVGVRTLPPADKDRVLLTFDDGPHPEGTPPVLDVLRKYHARAVFFVVGSRVHRAPALLSRIVEEGHLLGNHSYVHEPAELRTVRRYREDLERCQALIEDLAGCRPSLFRPPLGDLTLSGMIAARRLRLHSVFWSVDCDDWRMRADGDVPPYAGRLEKALSHRTLQDIVLLHDERPFTAMLLDRVLPGLVQRGVDLSSGVEAI